MGSVGTGHSGGNVSIVNDPVLVAPASDATVLAGVQNGGVVFYQVTDGGAGYQAPPFLYFAGNIRYQATARAMLNDDGEIVRVIHGPVPLSRERRGEDVMLTDALGFDLRVYDPGRRCLRIAKRIRCWNRRIRRGRQHIRTAITCREASATSVTTTGRHLRRFRSLGRVLMWISGTGMMTDCHRQIVPFPCQNSQPPFPRLPSRGSLMHEH